MTVRATLGSGEHNSIQTNAFYAFLGGGGYNTIEENANSSFLGGGLANSIKADAYGSFLGGGRNNTNGAAFSMLPGGYENFAGGKFSLAARRRAKAEGDGSFVWGDSTEFDVYAHGANQFVVRATGGYWLISAVDAFTGNPTAGVTLPAGSGTWGSISDRNAKTNCRPVDPRTVLAQVVALPIASWNYKTQDPSIRHLGPMAQDFYAAFGVGDTDTTITTVDADGVALAAIQGLNQKEEQDVASLRAENAALNDRLARLEQLFRQLTTKGD